MPYIQPKGNPQSPIWLILEKPFPSDLPAGILASGGMGFFLEKMFREAYINTGDVYVLARRPDTDSPTAVSSVDNFISTYKPPLLLFSGESAQFFLPECKPTGGASYKGQLGKYAGSLLKLPGGSWEHWCIPIAEPEALIADWTERNVTTYSDFAKIHDELAYWTRTRTVRPYLERKLISHDLSTTEISDILDQFSLEKNFSCDIETIYPRKNSEFYGEHPGVPITIGLASSPTYAVSFSPYRDSISDTILIMRKLDSLFRNVGTIIGQNFFNFDSFFLNMLGFSLSKERFSDTLIRHHICWPELPHSLQFLTRQYTRQPFYKDEGRSWSIKRLGELRHYNCLDAAVTYEVWLEQEKEFNQRPHLR